MAEQKLITLKINDRETRVAQGTLVIEAARRLGIEVPSFCYYPGLSLQAACRMCLCRGGESAQDADGMHAHRHGRDDRSHGHSSSSRRAERHA